jgi:hypothetical protein
VTCGLRYNSLRLPERQNFRLKTVNKFYLFGQMWRVFTLLSLWLIPISEMNYNKALDPANDQNPGY